MLQASIQLKPGIHQDIFYNIRKIQQEESNCPSCRSRRTEALLLHIHDEFIYLEKIMEYQKKCNIRHFVGT
jgi:C4-type Zn-finger protein